jgi:hypothetical protein
LNTSAAAHQLADFLLHRYHNDCAVKVIASELGKAPEFAALVAQGLSPSKPSGIFTTSIYDNLTFTDPMMDNFLKWNFECIVNVVVASDFNPGSFEDPKEIIDFTLKLSSRDRSSNILMVFEDAGLVDGQPVRVFLSQRLRNFPSVCLMNAATANLTCNNNLFHIRDSKLGRGIHSVSSFDYLTIL